MKNVVQSTSLAGMLISMLMLSGCMSKGIEMTEQQQRMARCDQYVDMARDQCLRGDNVTIDDYKEEYKEFENDIREKKELAQKAALADKQMKTEKLRTALKNAKEMADKARQEAIEKELKKLEDSTQ